VDAATGTSSSRNSPRSLLIALALECESAASATIRAYRIAHTGINHCAAKCARVFCAGSRPKRKKKKIITKMHHHGFGRHQQNLHRHQIPACAWVIRETACGFFVSMARTLHFRTDVLRLAAPAQTRAQHFAAQWLIQWCADPVRAIVAGGRRLRIQRRRSAMTAGNSGSTHGRAAYHVTISAPGFADASFGCESRRLVQCASLRWCLSLRRIARQSG